MGADSTVPWRARRPVTHVLEQLRRVEWTVTRDPRSGMLIGVCEPLNLNALGETDPQLEVCG
mgnify:CR=1 FL=1